MAPPLLQQKYAFLLQMCGERGERRSALREKHSSLLSTAMRQHSSCDAACKLENSCCTLFAPARLALVILDRQLVTLRLHTSGFTLFVSSCLARITSRDGLPGPPQRQRSAAERTLEAFSSAAAGGEANSLTEPRRPTLGFGVNNTVTSRAAIHFFNVLFVR